MVEMSTKDLPAHKYETDMLNNEAIKSNAVVPASPMTLFELYVDNFIAATNDGWRPHLNYRGQCSTASMQSSHRRRLLDTVVMIPLHTKN